MVVYKYIPVYFMGGVLGFVTLFILCCICNLVCPYEKIRQRCAMCCGYEVHNNMAQKQRRKLLDNDDDEEEDTIYLKYHRTHLI